MLFRESTVRSIIIIENTDIIHNIFTIHVGAIHYSYWHWFLLVFYISSHEGKIVEAHVIC